MACALEELIDTIIKENPKSERAKELAKLGGTTLNANPQEEYYSDFIDDHLDDIAEHIYADMGGTIKLSPNTPHKMKEYEIEDLKVASDMSTVTVTTKLGTFTFDVMITPNGKALIQSHPTDAQGNIKTAYGEFIADISSKAIDRVNNTLKSDPNATKFPTKSENLRKGALSSIEGIKEVIDELPDTGMPKGYKKYVKQLLDNVDPEFIPNLQLYINKEADKNDGQIDNINLVINVSDKELIKTGEMSATEVYAHELMHSITKFAIDGVKDNSEASDILSEIYKLRDYAQENITWKDLMPKNVLDKKAEEKLAKDRYRYIFEGKNSIHEFIAHGLTNPRLMRELTKLTKEKSKPESTTLLKLLENMVRALFNKVLGTEIFTKTDKNVRARLHQLTFELMKHNNEAVNKVEQEESIAKKVLKFIDLVGNEPLKKAINKALDSYNGDELPTRPGKDSTKLQDTIYSIKVLPRIMTDDRLRGVREGMLDALGMSPEGTIQSIIRDIERADELDRKVEMDILKADAIDGARELSVSESRKLLMEKFDEKPNDVQEEAITIAMLDTDLQTIYETYGKAKIKRILKDREALNKEISKVESQLYKLDRDNYNWNSVQATGLGYYLATGKANVVQNLNATSIAMGILSGQRYTPNKKVVAKLDELSTLWGLHYSDQGARDIAADMIENEPKGMDYTMKMAKGFVKQSRAQLFETDINVIKGYTKQLSDASIDITIAPVSEQENLRMNGYELDHTITNREGMKIEEMALYTSKRYVNSSYKRAAVRYTDMGRKGTSLAELYRFKDDALAQQRAKIDLIKLREKGIELADKMRAGTYSFVNDERDGRSPILDKHGKIIDYRYMMDKKTKRKLLNQDIHMSEVLSRGLANIADKVDTVAHNEAVLETILADQKKNYSEGSSLGSVNGKKYVRIQANSPRKDVQEIFKILPNSFKQAIRDTDDGYIAVRQDMLYSYFGYRNPSIVDFFGIHKVTPEIIQQWIRTAEAIWQDIVSISKVDIIIRIPAVFIGNMISNIMYSIVMGRGTPMQIAKKQYRSWINTKRYIETRKKLEKLKERKMFGENVSRAIEGLQKDLERNPAHILMEKGMYQAIVEDVTKKDIKSSNRLAQIVNDKTNGMPEYIKSGINWLYINEKTPVFGVIAKGLQISDFAARLTEYELLMEEAQAKYNKKKLSGTFQRSKYYEDIKEKAAREVLDVFVNYSKPSGKFEEYLNNMGAIMFTKYAKRIQRALIKSGKEKPVNVMLSALFQDTFMDIDDIWDQHLLTKSYSTIGINPLTHIQNAMTPSMLQAVGFMD